MIDLLTDKKVSELLENGLYRNSDKLGQALTKVENDIVANLLKGYDSKQSLAAKLAKSENTIRNQLVSIQDKLNVNTMLGIVAYWINQQTADDNILQLIKINEVKNEN